MMRLLAGLAALAFIAPALADCRAESGNMRVALLELYTSEGCSSCPPADRWFSRLAETGYGSDKLVPLAFHVDYWDYIGWQDRFADPAFSARQRNIASRNAAGFVYTPQLVFNGADLRGWRQSERFRRLVEHGGQEPAHAKLKLNIATRSNGEIAIQAAAQARQIPNEAQAEIYLAVYENGLESRINAGENSGRVLHHDYVVREWHGPYRFDAQDGWRGSFMLPADWKGRRGGVAAFVQDARSGEVLQALSLDLCS